MAVSAKTLAKRHARVSTGWRADVPKFNIMDYRLSMMHILRFFAADVEGKEKQALAIKFWAEQKKNVTGLALLSDGWFCQAGPLAYLIDAGISLESRDIQFLEQKYQDLMKKVVKVVKEEPEKVAKSIKVPKEDLTLEAARKIGAEIDGHIEIAFTKKGKYDFDVKSFLSKSQVQPAVLKVVATFYKGTLEELLNAGDDGEYQFNEGYSYLGKVGLKRMIDFFKNILSACENVALMVKTTRKPRARKEKPAAVLVSKMKYLKEDADLKLKSITPAKIVGASEVWVFNTKYRKLFQYVAQDGMTLSVKGTTILNFDPAKSGAKTIRKPDVFFSGLDSATKRSMKKLFDDIKSVLAKATGRVNEEIIILKAF